MDPDDLASWGDRIRLRFGDASRTARRVETYALLKTGEVGLVVDSYGLLAVSIDRGSAAHQLGLHAGDPITLDRLVDEEDNTVRVELGRRP